jgi:hypothetical protein
MTTLTRFVAVVGGLALLAAPAYSQDAPRRQDSTGAPAGPFGGRGRFGFGRGTMPIPRVGPLAGYQDSVFQKTVDLGSRGTIDLSNTVGQVRISGTQGNSVRITATKRVQQTDPDAARALMTNIIIRVTERGGGVEVFTELPTTKTPVPTLVDYDIAVPMSASVSLHNQGNVFIANVKGELRAEAFSGDMVLTGVSRVRRAKTFSGSLFINGAEGEEVSAEVAGTLRMSNVHARNVETRTIAGVTTAFDVDCERCTFTSVSGDIDLIGPLRRNARYDISTNSGNIRVVIPDGPVGFDLEATTVATLRSDFTLKPTTPSSPASGNRFLRGSYGDGSAILSLRSFTGNVTVAKPGPGSGPRSAGR